TCALPICSTLDQHLADFARRQLELRVVAFARDQLSLRAGRTGHLAALAGLQLDIVDYGAGRNIFERKRIADQNIGRGSGQNLAPDFETRGGQDVALLAIDVVQQGNARTAVRVVFDGGNDGRDARLVALEIDFAIGFLVAA